jgi:hypothetical protein
VGRFVRSDALQRVTTNKEKAGLLLRGRAVEIAVFAAFAGTAAPEGGDAEHEEQCEEESAHGNTRWKIRARKTVQEGGENQPEMSEGPTVPTVDPFSLSQVPKGRGVGSV